jgi:hypothetical protein
MGVIIAPRGDEPTMKRTGPRIHTSGMPTRSEDIASICLVPYLRGCDHRSLKKFCLRAVSELSWQKAELLVLLLEISERGKTLYVKRFRDQFEAEETVEEK